MNKEYKIKLDLNKKLYNQKMAFNQFDENVNDFYIEVTKNNEAVKDLDKSIITLVAIKPNNAVDAQFIEVKEGQIYADLKPSMCDLVGNYQAKAMIVLEGEIVTTDTINYSVNEDKIISRLNDDVVSDERFTLFTDALARLSTIEANEDNRKNNFSKIQEEFEAIKNNHNELVTTQTDKKVIELLDPIIERVDTKIDEVDNKISEVNEFVKAKEIEIDKNLDENTKKINDKIIDIDHKTLVNTNKIDVAISKIPPKSELIGPQGPQGVQGPKGDKGDIGPQGLKGDTGEQGPQGLKGPKGDKGDVGPQGPQGNIGPQGPKGDIGAIGPQGPVGPQGLQGDVGPQGPQGVKGDTPSITHLETSINNKIKDVETRFNALTSKQQQDAEVIDARDGETSLKTRLDRDIEKAKQVYVNVEGSNISTDSSSGYAKDIEILGNTIQSASNLADIRSVGDKVEGQELYEIPVLSRGKNLFIDAIYKKEDTNGWSPKIKIDKTKSYVCKYGSSVKTPYIRFFDENLKTIPLDETFSKSGRVIKNASYFSIQYVNSLTNIQLEEGTVATPYEPYVEDELTILSPVQLEKVGDVADRIIEKDGVWGVEKNIGHITLSNLNFSQTAIKGSINVFETIVPNMKPGIVICNKLPYLNDSNSPTEHIRTYNSENKLQLFVSNTKNINEFKNELFIKCVITQPTFIPLPHDQQIKLRTFANKTNISFLTEIEGTIKAQVPKSLGATVNTHTEQINNLNKELDRVKKLEESTVSTVTTESDFTTVEATNNGYFEDVKLEGKTLVNLAKKLNSYSHAYVEVINENCLKINQQAAGNVQIGKSIASMNMKPNTKYTVICNVKENTLSDSIQLVHSYADVFGSKNIVEVPKKTTGLICGLFETVEGDSKPITIQVPPNPNEQGYIVLENLVYLEGDHTQNPPSYFEGLKSIGDGVDEIVVSSTDNGNLTDGTFIKGTVNSSTGDLNPSTGYSFVTKDIIPVFPNHNLKWKSIGARGFRVGNNTNVFCYGKNNEYLYRKVGLITFSDIEIPTDCYGIRIMVADFELDTTTTADMYKVHTTMSNNTTNIEIAKTDKKRLLYYNDETQTWEKPILREWDSIEKHANGKYYYHVRSKEGDYIEGDESLNDCITDLTVSVKKLAEEKVYECTNIDLITYANETNYIVNCGAIVPKTTLKVHNNISNVVSLLQKKVSLLESNVKASQEVQDMMILETDMRMLDIELALMEFVPITLNLGGSDMLRSATYFNFLKNHIVNETYEKEYLENVMNKYLATGRINQDEYNELYKMLYPPVYDIELPIEY